MRRRIARPYGQATSAVRLASMLMGLLVLWALFQRLKDPATWQMFADDKTKPAASVEVSADQLEWESLVPGPNDQDDAEVAAIQPMLEMVTDKTELKPQEMDAYWRLMQWSLTEPFALLKQRARSDVLFRQLWLEPEKYRGQPIQLRLHVRQIVKWDAKEKSSGIANDVYEAWGWTDESRSFPYVVVFSEAPPGMVVGSDLRVEFEFVGFFLKVMSYTAYDNRRAAPLLVGRVRMVTAPKVVSATSSEVWVIVLAIVGVVGLVALVVRTIYRPRTAAKLSMLPNELSELNVVEGAESEKPFDVNWDEKSPVPNQ